MSKETVRINIHDCDSIVIKHKDNPEGKWLEISFGDGIYNSEISIWHSNWKKEFPVISNG